MASSHTGRITQAKLCNLDHSNQRLPFFQDCKTHQNLHNFTLKRIKEITDKWRQIIAKNAEYIIKYNANIFAFVEVIYIDKQINKNKT